MKNIILFLSFIFTALPGIISLEAQVFPGIRGGEIVKYTTNSQRLVIRVLVYRAGESKESIPVFWGDGMEEILPLSYSSLHSSGFRLDTYWGEHIYDTTGYVEVGFTD